MGLIKNFDYLASTPERKVVLEMIEAGLQAIQPQEVFTNNFILKDSSLQIQDKKFDLTKYQRIFLVGFGKGCALMCKIMEERLGNYLSEGFVIDIVEQTFHKLQFTKGTHPLPSQENLSFTQNVLEKLQSLTEKDLVFIVVCGGGSVLFEHPYKIDLEKLTAVNKALLQSGATISEMNVIRKHLSSVKGGGFVKHLYPAAVISLIFSDVPGNDLFVIASGPTVKDPTTIADVQTVMDKYQLQGKVNLSPDDFHETPKEDMYFTNVSNILMLSNLTVLSAIQKKAEELGQKTFVYSDRLQGDAKEIGKMLIEQAKPGQMLLAGGETTVKVTGTGQGGRNQTLVLGSLQFIQEGTVIASFDSDGWDFYGYAGAIGDSATIKKMQELGLNPKEFLDNDDSYTFFQKVGDGIDTGKLESNVSDIMMVLKK